MKPKPYLAPFVRLVREGEQQVSGPIKSPADIAALVAPLLAREEVEAVLVLTLTSAGRVRAITEVTRGLVNSSLIHPREVFRIAVGDGAAAIVVVHNHPSGDPTPSAEDIAVTRQLTAAGDVLGIELYDHVIIGDATHYISMAERGLLNQEGGTT